MKNQVFWWRKIDNPFDTGEGPVVMGLLWPGKTMNTNSYAGAKYIR
jgi:hypothetical protein